MGLVEYLAHGREHLRFDLRFARQPVLIEHGRAKGARFIPPAITHAIGLGGGQIIFTAAGVTENERMLKRRVLLALQLVGGKRFVREA